MEGIHKPLFGYSTQERLMSNLIELGHVVLKKTNFNKYLYFPYFSWESLGYCTLVNTGTFVQEKLNCEFMDRSPDNLIL